MSKEGYYRIIKAILDLLFVIMTEAGRVSANAAGTITKNIYKSITGGDINK